jgi:hypothetical protein
LRCAALRREAAKLFEVRSFEARSRSREAARHQAAPPASGQHKILFEVRYKSETRSVISPRKRPRGRNQRNQR